MENDLLDGRTIEMDQLLVLPSSFLAESPLLSMRLGETYRDCGRLPEAQKILEIAVKGFALLSMSAHLLEAMAELVPVQLRLGDLSAAETLAVFLRDEYIKTPAGEKSGRISRALALSSRLLSWEKEAKALFQEAVRSFKENGRLDLACRTIVEAAVLFGSEMSEGEWKEWEWDLGRWTARNERFAAPASCLLQALQMERQGLWVTAYDRLTAMDSHFGLPYDLAAAAETLLLRASVRVRPDAVGRSLERIRKRKDSYPSDLQLQYDLSLAMQEGLSTLGHREESAKTAEEIKALARLLKWPPPQHSAPPAAAETNPSIRMQPASGTGESWRVSLFGGLRFIKGQDEVRSIRWKRRKAQELFLFLLLQHRYRCVKDLAAETLQMGDDPDKSASAVYVIVHQLKQTLLQELGIREGVSVKEGVIFLREDAIEYVDVERYLVLVRVADQLWMKDRDLSAEMYQEAYMMYGELLPEHPYLPWLDTIREHLLEKQISVIRKCCKLAEDGNDVLLLEGYLQEWIRLRPYQEEAYRKLIELFMKTDKRREAELIYERWSELCRDELGIEPSQQLRRLLEGFRR
jgi:two-component SAPR family response regulator